MLKYIIRLDDACPTMNEKKWNEMEKLLNKYNIKPIVGIIPDNKDKSFNYEKIYDFWTKYAKKWEKQGWIIAQHGLNHNLSSTIRTEFSGKSYKVQKDIIDKGYQILKDHDITPICFFAPAHTFDKNTIKVCKESNYFQFISDGYSLYPYVEDNMIFFPSIFDTPHKISNNGIFTFVFHPNNTTKHDIERLERFIVQHEKNFEVNIKEIIEKYKNRKRSIIDKLLHLGIIIYRIIIKNRSNVNIWKEKKFYL